MSKICPNSSVRKVFDVYANEVEEMESRSQEPEKSNFRTQSVLVIAPQPFFENRGTPLNVRAVVTALANAGYQTDLLVFPIGERIKIAGVSIHRCFPIPLVSSVPIGASWKKLVFDFLILMKGMMLVFKKRYAVIHGVEDGGFIAGFLAIITRRPFVFDLDSCMSSQLQSGLPRGFKWLLRGFEGVEKRFLKRARAALTVCSALTEKVNKLSPYTPVYQIEDFPVSSATKVDSELVARLRREWFLEEKRVVLYTGNFRSLSGHRAATRGLSNAGAENPERARATSRSLVVSRWRSPRG